MDQKKVGEFIALIRKEKGYTQRQIAEQLGISEKTVSKWECGLGLPEVCFMMPLCEILGITVNELLSGEKIPILEMLKKMEESSLELVKQIEILKLKERVFKQYEIEVDEVETSPFGAGSLTYFITEGNKKYVVKYPAENGMNHIENETAICEYLLSHGIPACNFIKNKQGQVISADENGRQYHVQEYIEGVTYDYHEVPTEILMESAKMLASIHKTLADYPRLHSGIGSDFFKYRTVEGTLASLKGSLQRALSKSDDDIVYEIRSNIEILQHFPNYVFHVEKFTMSNTHGDYMPTQLLCLNHHINGVIDWTCACVHPVVWEVIRSYAYSSPRCKDGCIDIPEFIQYVKEYMGIQRLSQYDLENMGKMFFYFTAVCDFYGQYYDSLTANRDIFLKQALFSSKLLRWFDKNIEELTRALSELSKEV